MKPRAWLAALALLALGAVLGITFDRFHVRGGHNPLSRLHEQLRHDPMAVMERELNLRPAQRTRIAAILELRQGDINAVWEDTHIRLRATIDSVVTEIAAELDSAQARKFRDLADKLHNAPGFLPQPSH